MIRPRLRSCLPELRFMLAQTRSPVRALRAGKRPA